MHYDTLPSFSYNDETDEAIRLNELEKETWLIRPQTYKAKLGASGLQLSSGHLAEEAVHQEGGAKVDGDRGEPERFLSCGKKLGQWFKHIGKFQVSGELNLENKVYSTLFC